MFKLCLGYLKSTQLINTYANTIQNLFIVCTQLCIYYAIESSAFPSDLHPMYSLHVYIHIYIYTYIASRSSLLFPTSFLAFTQCYVYSMLCDETYLQPMFSLCDMLIQLYHEIKVTQLLHKRIFSCVTHMRNNVVYAFPLGMLMVQVKQRSQKAYFQSIKQCFKLKNLKIICSIFFVLADSFLVRRFMF